MSKKCISSVLFSCVTFTEKQNVLVGRQLVIIISIYSKIKKTSNKREEN